VDLITLDMETYYDQQYSLSKLTTEEYIRDPRFSVIGVGTKVNNGPTQWVSGPATEVLEHLRALPWDNAMLLAHKTMFDGAILTWRCGIRPKALADTMLMSRALFGPEVSHSLKAVAERYGVGEKGDEVVRALGKRRTEFEPDELARYGEYCVNDVELTYDIFQRMLTDEFPLKELKLIDVTLRMFTEPMLELDGAHLRTHLQNVQARKQALLDAAGVTDKKDLMSNQKFATMLRSFGVEPPMKISATTGKETYAFAKTDEDFKALEEHEDERVQTIVAARLGNKSTLEETRTERFIQIASRGTLPVPIRYCAAHTSRWGGSDKINLQNLPSRGANAKQIKQSIVAPSGLCVDRRRLRADRSTGAGMAG
jgi:DNA polymerase I-like protein with 3'-5' exonuclease and polymerase domains